ncbi:MAG TPA: hypothetical protein VF170_09310 [Planctomycetaceae bacterium]
MIVQHRPHEFRPRDAHALLASQPLARFVVGLGPWCASHGRSERTWPEAAAVPLHDLSARLRREAVVLAGARAGPPITAGRDDVVSFDISAVAPAACPGVVVIDTPDPAFAKLLTEITRAAGGTVVPVGDDAAAVALWDAAPIGGERLGRLKSLRSCRPSCRIVVMTALPTAADSAALRRAGADAVLPKPFAVTELIAALAGDSPTAIR